MLKSYFVNPVSVEPLYDKRMIKRKLEIWQKSDEWMVDHFANFINKEFSAKISRDIDDKVFDDVYDAIHKDFGFNCDKFNASYHKSMIDTLWDGAYFQMEVHEILKYSIEQYAANLTEKEPNLDKLLGVLYDFDWFWRNGFIAFRGIRPNEYLVTSLDTKILVSYNGETFTW